MIPEEYIIRSSKVWVVRIVCLIISLLFMSYFFYQTDQDVLHSRHGTADKGEFVYALRIGVNFVVALVFAWFGTVGTQRVK